jgi:ribosomal RNA-processing protein 17
MTTSNTSLITRSHAVYSAKKPAKKTQEVLFDEDARRYVMLSFITAATHKPAIFREYLTEFQKQVCLALVLADERLDQFAPQHRQELAEHAMKNVKKWRVLLVFSQVSCIAVTLPHKLSVLLKVDSTANPDITHETTQEEELEYEDEEQLAVVTVVKCIFHRTRACTRH